MTTSRACLGVLLVAACSLGCSEHATGNGLEPDRPGNGAGPGTSNRALLRIGPSASRCYVAPGWVELDIALMVTFTSGDTQWAEPYRWSFYCWAERCEGTVLNIPRGSRSGAIETFPLTGARITNIRGLVGTVQWRDSIFVVDANYGRVTFTGSALDDRPGLGEAQCDEYGTMVPAKEKNADEIRT